MHAASISPTQATPWEIERDAALVAKGWEVEWVLRDDSVSKPRMDKLIEVGITVRIGN